jgi:hypothetical protein
MIRFLFWIAAFDILLVDWHSGVVDTVGRGPLGVPPTLLVSI